MSLLSQIGIFLKRKPLLFNSIIYGSFYVTAEFVQQTYNKKNNTENKVSKKTNIEHNINHSSVSISELKILYLNTYDWSTLRRYFVYGYFIAGPILHGWYLWLDRMFVGRSKKTVITKLLCDQFILTPPLVFLFFTSMSLMERKDDILYECKIKFFKTFQTSCLFWLPMQFLNFWIIHPSYRVLYVSIASFCWVNILCNLKRAPILMS